MKQLWAAGPMYADDPAVKMTTDSILLADFAAQWEFSRCMDLGCGGGILSVLLHETEPDAVFDGVDLRQGAVDVCRENFRANHIRGNVGCADVRQYRSMGQGGGYDLVVCNPPYFYGSKPSPDGDRATARSSLSPAQFSSAAAYLLRRGGIFCLCHKPEYLTDIFAAMRLADIEPKCLRMVCHKIDAAPTLVLIAGRRGARPGLEAMPTLVIRQDDDSPTPEIRRIYHMQK